APVHPSPRRCHGDRPDTGCVGHYRLAVVPTSVVEAGGRWTVADGSVGAVMVVVIEEGLEGVGSFLVGGIEPAVGPLPLQGLVEGLGLAVGLRSVGAGVAKADVVGGRGGEEVG